METDEIGPDRKIDVVARPRTLDVRQGIEVTVAIGFVIVRDRPIIISRVHGDIDRRRNKNNAPTPIQRRNVEKMMEQRIDKHLFCFFFMLFPKSDVYMLFPLEQNNFLDEK